MEIRRNVLLPNLLTLANGVCGFYAVTELCKIQLVTPDGSDPLSFTLPQAFSKAAWLIMLGMLFDVFDGKVARMSGGESALGAMLDSLCDFITFGLAPALMVLRLNMGYAPVWQRVVWGFALVYFVGALLRLARFTAESGGEEEEHLAFKGLPSPGAAGCVASLVIFYRYVTAFNARELNWLGDTARDLLQTGASYIPLALPFLSLVLGFTMVSNRLRFPHMGSMVFQKTSSFDFFAYLIFGGIFVALIPEVILPIVFLGYLFAVPATWLYRRVRPKKDAKPDPDGSST